MPLSLPSTSNTKKTTSGTMVAFHASMAAFITYMSMYAFRKPFTAATYDGLQLWAIDYKIVLIISQLIGYTLSKYIGIKLISELKADQRIKTLVLLMGIAWGSLLLFAIVPYPYNFPFMFLNGLPLGLIWGVVFSFLEGRRCTELLGAVMASSFIVSSGLVKAVGKYLIEIRQVDDLWMPFITGLIFLPILYLGIQLLKRVPPPDEQDIELRSIREPMDREDRIIFIRKFGLGIFLLILIYVALTVFRELRDNFAVEFWTDLGYGQTPEVLILSEVPIAIAVLIIIAGMIWIKNNKIAFYATIWTFVCCGLLLILTTTLFVSQTIGPWSWMIIGGFMMYLPYIAFHTILYERWIAHFRFKSNIGFLMYLSDAAGYLGGTAILLYKNFGRPEIRWLYFFKSTSYVVGFAMIVLALGAWIFFNSMEPRRVKTKLYAA